MAQDRIRNTEEIQKSADRKKLIERRMDEFKHGKQDIVCDYDDYNELKELIEENGWSRSYVNAIKGYIQVGDNIPTDEELSSVVVREQYIKLLRQLVRKRLGQATAGFILAALFVSLTIGIAKHAPKCSSDEPVKKDEPPNLSETKLSKNAITFPSKIFVYYIIFKIVIFRYKLFEKIKIYKIN